MHNGRAKKSKHCSNRNQTPKWRQTTEVTPAPTCELAGSLRILVVEDEFVSARTAVGLFSAYGQCELCTNGPDALKAFENAAGTARPFDLVVLDIRMEGMSGLETLEALRAWESRRGVLLGQGVQVIMTTICHDARTVLGAFNSGCETYLIKPIGAETVAGAMRLLGLLATV